MESRAKKQQIRERKIRYLPSKIEHGKGQEEALEANGGIKGVERRVEEECATGASAICRDGKPRIVRVEFCEVAQSPDACPKFSPN